jgi:hypothetical protein
MPGSAHPQGEMQATGTSGSRSAPFMLPLTYESLARLLSFTMATVINLQMKHATTARCKDLVDDFLTMYSIN